MPPHCFFALHRRHLQKTMLLLKTVLRYFLKVVDIGSLCILWSGRRSRVKLGKPSPGKADELALFRSTSPKKPKQLP